jgi:hypothetical protein
MTRSISRLETSANASDLICDSVLHALRSLSGVLDVCGVRLGESCDTRRTINRISFWTFTCVEVVNTVSVGLHIGVRSA